MILTGDTFSSATLYDWGFLNRIVPREKLMDEAMTFAERIAGNGPDSVRGMVRLANLIKGESLKNAMKKEIEIGMPVFMSEQAREGVRAQRERRKPDFK